MKVATNRTNLNYAHILKSKGYKTAIHALPQDGIDLVHSLLERGFSNADIANEVNRQYSKYLEGLGLQQISYYSVKTYKENHWKNGDGFAKLATSQCEAIKAKIEQLNYEANEMLKSFDGLRKMIAIAKKSEALILTRDSTLENNPMGMIDSNRSRERMNFFTMCKQIHDTYVALGIVKPCPPPIKVDVTVEDKKEELSDEEQIERLTEILKVLKGEGIYDKEAVRKRIESHRVVWT